MFSEEFRSAMYNNLLKLTLCLGPILLMNQNTSTAEEYPDVGLILEVDCNKVEDPRKITGLAGVSTRKNIVNKYAGYIGTIIT